MLNMWLLASPADRIAAGERAYYAVRDHGDYAEQHLRSRLSRVRSRRRRRVYRLAIGRLRAVGDAQNRRGTSTGPRDGMGIVATDATQLIARTARQVEYTASVMTESPHRAVLLIVAARLREADTSLRTRIHLLAPAMPARYRAAGGGGMAPSRQAVS